MSNARENNRDGVIMMCLDNKMVELYEGAAQVYPKNEEILTQLFMAYVRVGSYQKQQQVAPSTHSILTSRAHFTLHTTSV